MNNDAKNKEGTFKSKFFLKLFFIPSIAWVVLSLLAIIPDEAESDPLTWGDLIITDIEFLIIWFVISFVIYSIYRGSKKENIRHIEKEKTEVKFEEISTFQKIRFPFIMSIITFILGVFWSYDSIGFFLRTRMKILLVSFLPFIIFSIITFIIYKFKEKSKVVSYFKTTSIVISFFLVFYYFNASFYVVFLEASNPMINPKYYNYHIHDSRLKKAFPNKIPKDAENVIFFYVPGFLQGGTKYTLYYIDKNMTFSEFNQKYQEKANWMGHINEYMEKRGLLSGAFYDTPAEYSQNNNENDFIIYLIDGNCDNSGYCNHGDYLFAAYNEKTREVVFSSEIW